MKNKIFEIKKKAFKLSTDHQDGQAWLPLKDALDLFDEIQFDQPAVSEEEIDKLFYKYADTEKDFGNLFLSRDAYDLLMDAFITSLNMQGEGEPPIVYTGTNYSIDKTGLSPQEKGEKP